jgi:hypothetical protein
MDFVHMHVAHFGAPLGTLRAGGSSRDKNLSRKTVARRRAVSRGKNRIECSRRDESRPMCWTPDSVFLISHYLFRPMKRETGAHETK